MEIRQATTADLPAVEALWRAYAVEVPEPAHIVVDDATELEKVRAVVANELAFLAEDDRDAVAFALVARVSPTLARLTDLYVAPEARRGGIAAALIREVVSQLSEVGVAHLELEVLSNNAAARAVYQRWGFAEHTLSLVAGVDAFHKRLAPETHTASFASLHVQTDDVGVVERAASAFAPRVGSAGTRVEGPFNGWTVVYDEVIDRERDGARAVRA